ncbi:MAG: Squalene--hopene cyclase [Verrucomicrobia subdivision 3 bacterium]|nr:Squalene--hopene cyclase [Limisphaerales bacterium]MCS1417772.1 Squalene--hopene cyclase [Limisphaerales bacterium]
MKVDYDRISAAFEKAKNALLAERKESHYWVGELSASPLSTATAVTALAIVDRVLSPHQLRYRELVSRGLEWIVGHVNPDGGWGDTDRSRSNVSTTVLCWSALNLIGQDGDHPFQETVNGAEAWLREHAGGLESEIIAEAVTKRYGKDRTFSVPILTMAALTGRLGAGRQAWALVKPLPFELAAFPPSWYAALQLPVVSYALPALIAIGIARHRHFPERSPILRGIRASFIPKCLSVLRAIQPANGGFLEATPLTSFVTMNLASSRLAGHPVTLKSTEFIVNSVREDGSWAIDANLSTWVTTLSVNALGDRGLKGLPEEEFKGLSIWLQEQQYRKRHPYTQAEPGAWSWTNLPGGVPDADDTAGALIAMHYLWKDTDVERHVAKNGSNWLCRLQNHDGGIPTFCKGWGNLPFDRSSPDISAHTIRAWTLWIPKLMPNDQFRAKRALRRAVNFLLRRQRGDGTWCPLWFGNQEVAEDENPTYGTARVLLALIGLPEKERRRALSAIIQGVHWLILNQNDDGGWGGSYGTASSVEETSLSAEALLACVATPIGDEGWDSRWIRAAAVNGLEWLLERVEAGRMAAASPIGFYFAKLWYYERLYPLIFTVGALRRAMEVFQPEALPNVEEAAPESSFVWYIERAQFNY